MNKEKIRARFRYYRGRIADLNFELDCQFSVESRLSQKLKDTQYDLREAEDRARSEGYEAEERERENKQELTRIEEERDYYQRKAHRLEPGW